MPSLLGHKFCTTLDKGSVRMVADQLTRLRRFLQGVFPEGHNDVPQRLGDVVEIDSGHGLKTRFGHLAAIYVKVGQRIAIGTKLGGIGSTGRSIGPRLHDEVWVDGRLQNPERFLEAGEYVQQATE